MSGIPQAIAPVPHTNLLNVYIQIANKMGFQAKKVCESVSMLKETMVRRRTYSLGLISTKCGMKFTSSKDSPKAYYV
jgi:hypothetical protein